MTELKDCYLVTLVDDTGQAKTLALTAENDGRGRAAELAESLRKAGIPAAAYEPIADVEPPAMRDWTTDYPAKYRDVLRKHGIGPQDHKAAREYNARLIERVEAGLNGQQLADAADSLFDDLIWEREIEIDEDFYDGYIDWKSLLLDPTGEDGGWWPGADRSPGPPDESTERPAYSPKPAIAERAPASLGQSKRLRRPSAKPRGSRHPTKRRSTGGA